MLRASDKLGVLDGIKGKVTVELFNAETKEQEFVVEKDNMVFSKSSSDYFFKELLLNLFSTFSSIGYSIGAPQLQIPSAGTRYAKMYINDDTSDVLESESLDVKIPLAIATRGSAYSGSVADRGTLNVNESVLGLEGKVRFVFDFATDRANGTFQSVGFFHGFDGSKASNNFASLLQTKARYKPSAVTDYGLAVQVDETTVAFIKRNTTTTYLKFVDIESGELIGTYYTMTTHLGANLARAVAVKKRGSYYYVLALHSASNMSGLALYKYSDLTSNAISETPIDLGLGTASYYRVDFDFIDDNTIVLSSGGGYVQDTVLGIRAKRVLYVVDITTGLVTGRKDIRPNVNLADGCCQLRTQGKTKIDPWDTAEEVSLTVGIFVKDGFVHVLYISDDGGTNNYFLDITLDITNDYEHFSIRKVYYDSRNYHSLAQFVVYLVLDGNLCVTANYNNNTSSYYWYSIYHSYYGSDRVENMFGFYNLGWEGSKASRVLLPAPVTKLNTQTMKITYDLVFPEGYL